MMNFEGGKKNDHIARRLAKDVRVEDAKLCTSAMTPEEVGKEESSPSLTACAKALAVAQALVNTIGSRQERKK